MELINDALDGRRAIIFDCDGTLVDSAPIYARAWAAGFAIAGGEMPRDWYFQRSGLSEHVLMDQFEEAFGVTLDRVGTVTTMRLAFLDAIVDLREVEAIAEIARLASGLMPIAVASGGPRAIVHPSLRQTGLDRLFRTIVTFEDVGIAKPAPDLFLEAARQMGVEPAQCLVLEDSETGIDAALAAGMGWVDVRDNVACAKLASQVARRRIGSAGAELKACGS
ncbi:MAG TPA: HAD family phosphatase [Acetobacteraceae bacterium]|nr:HAD family phosphatase [Acetobacteraceae bacterium]